MRKLPRSLAVLWGVWRKERGETLLFSALFCSTLMARMVRVVRVKRVASVCI